MCVCEHVHVRDLTWNEGVIPRSGVRGGQGAMGRTVLIIGMMEDQTSTFQTFFIPIRDSVTEYAPTTMRV